MSGIVCRGSTKNRLDYKEKKSNRKQENAKSRVEQGDAKGRVRGKSLRIASIGKVALPSHQDEDRAKVNLGAIIPK